MLIVAPITPAADRFGALIASQIDSEVEIIRAAGGRIIRIHPDAGALDAFGPNLMGPNLMDPAHRGSATDAGLRQGRSHAATVAALWD